MGIFEFDLAPEAGYQRPAFINLQQYYLEKYLIEWLCELGADLRWRNTVTAVEPYADGVGLTVETPDGPYRMLCDYLIVADGARSPVRHLLGLSCQDQVFQDHFLIADVVMQADFPTERWFWFKPPFHTGQSALLESYDTERILAADENILNSSRSTDFIIPRSEASRAFRDATLMLAEHYPFARGLVNSGRLSVPAVLYGSPLSTPDAEAFDSALGPGSPCLDALSRQPPAGIGCCASLAIVSRGYTSPRRVRRCRRAPSKLSGALPPAPYRLRCGW